MKKCSIPGPAALSRREALFSTLFLLSSNLSAAQSDLPLTLGLLVDTSGSERRMLGTGREASHAFLEQVLRPVQRWRPRRRGGGMPGRGGPYGRAPFPARPDGKKILEQISRETGAAYFEASKKKSIDQIYAQIQEELRNQYSLGYTPDRPQTEAGYRKIQLTLRPKGLTVQARDGYYAHA